MFAITPQKLERAITPKTRLFIHNSPSNPTGTVYTLDDIRADLARSNERRREFSRCRTKFTSG